MNILCVADKKGRIQYSRCSILKKYTKNKCSIDVVALDENLSKIKFYKYDVIYYSHFSLYKKLKKRGRIYTCASVTSHKCFNNIKNTIEELKNFDKVSVNSNHILKKLSKYKKYLWYTPNGVDTNLFSFSNKPIGKPLTFGWVGNMDREEKNYNTILKPIMNRRRDVNFNIVGTKKSDKGSSLCSSLEMVNYYQNIDFYLVTSSAEGTPNPGLESMSCGTPVISTKVGNMTDIIISEKNGFLISDNINNFNEVIDRVKEMTENEYWNMKQKTRECVLSWDWKIRSKKWIRFFMNIR